MSKLLKFILLLFSTIPVCAQNNVTLSGYIKDAASGEAMIGATVSVPSLKAGAYSNDYGFYSLSLPPGTYEVEFRYVGYQPQTKQISLTENLKQDIELASAETTVEEVVISSEAADENVRSTEMGVTSLGIQEVKKIPVIFGETDVLKTIQLLPGVNSAGEGNSGFYVRGGGADQNLILLDEAPVYNASHLLGFFSVFNGDAIKSTKLYKGNMPAEYGGRLSSTLDIRMKEGNSKDYGISGGIGLISSRLTVEGPIVEDKGSFIVSGRRTYADLFLKLSSDEAINSSVLYFYDLNLKANYQLGEKDQVFLSGYFGRDNFSFSDQFGFDWGNVTGTLRWNHLFNDKLFLNSSFIYSDYDYDINFSFDDFDAKIQSGIKDLNLKEDLTWYHSPRHTFKFGLNAIYHTFVPGEVDFSDDEGFNDLMIDHRYAFETASYFSHDFTVSEKLKVTYGLRFSTFSVLENDDSREIAKTYSGLEPRITTAYILNPESSLKAAYTRNYQYVHLLSNTTSTTPTDVWIPTSEVVKPELADQFSLGYFRNLNENQYEASVEVYYKNLQNQIEYENGADLLLNEDVESQLVFGKGWSYGAEFLLRKKTGKFTGWIGYTWSRTERQFDEINNGEVFPARQDRTHDISIVGIYELNPKWSFSGTWVYNTGNAVTFPSGRYVVNGEVVPYYTERNGYRMPAYHRLDLGATWYGKNPRSNWNVSIYNAYGRKNPFLIEFRESETLPGTTEAVKLSLFSIVPSVTWNFDF